MRRSLLLLISWLSSILQTTLRTFAMALQLLFASAATVLLIIISVLVMRYPRASQTIPPVKRRDHLDALNSPPEPTLLSKSLALALPDSVIFPQNAAAFKQLINSYWARQECEVIPACVVRPHNTQQLCTAVTVLKNEYDERRKLAGEGKAEGLFAIRSGGHSPVSGAASIQGGVLIDLGLFCEVVPSEDGSSVAIGAGAKWMDVSRVLDEKGLAVVGGRNSAVGVGGLTLGGNLPLFMTILIVLLRLDCKSNTNDLRQQLCHFSVAELTQKCKQAVSLSFPLALA